jgi:pyrroloquinoline quinone (PQQ) biosynthesis protein C
MEALSAPEAKEHVDGLYRKVAQRWQERVREGEFMQRFAAGTLPREVLALFFKNWGAYTIEINTIVASTYHKYVHFFKQHPDLMAAMGDKIADEFIHPKPPGHVLIMLQTAEALGVSRDEVCAQPMMAEFRGKLDFARAVLYEGTAAEWFACNCGEEMIGYWAGECFRILTTRYGLTPEQAVYFSKHEEADLEEHDEGVMGHGQFNRACLQRLIETGQAWERPTYGLEYCALTFIDLHGLLLRSTLEAARRLQLVPA